MSLRVVHPPSSRLWPDPEGTSLPPEVNLLPARPPHPSLGLLRIRPAWEMSAAQRLGNRATQEDAFATWPGRQAFWVLVADGLGGHPLGEAASAVAIQAAVGTIASLEAGPPIPNYAHALTRVFHAAHRAVRRMSEPLKMADPPATTLLAAALRRHGIWLGHSGDSRAHLVRRDGTIRHLTTDMTPAGTRVEEGVIPWEAQNLDPDRDFLLYAVGTGELNVALRRVPWRPGDRLVLATDGLNALPDAAWQELWESPYPAEDAIARIVPDDNVTVITVTYPRRMSMSRA